MASTRVKNILIKKFRALSEVDIEIGTHITLICGKNGTSKSSILGVVAQAFSFDKNPTDNSTLPYKTISGDAFTSLPSEHFRFSEKFDPPGSMNIVFNIYDGYSNTMTAPNLGLNKRQGSAIARPVLRNNNTIKGKNTSRNLTHPVIFLSLKRLMPIASREKYEVKDLDYLKANHQTFLHLNNELLNKETSNATATAGTLKSAVAHGETYDQDSVSAGEDNAGQIILAIMSFRKLKEDYPEYKGGLLLIDEADAGLFPAAQAALIDILVRESEDLNLQVIMTSHSPIMIEKIYDLSKIYQRKYKTIYLSDTEGQVNSKADMSWVDIYADLMIETVKIAPDLSLPKVNIYFEDREGFDFYSHIMLRHPIKKIVTALSDVSMGCSNYIHLTTHKIPEFTKKSVIVLDGDVSKTEKIESIILLPSTLAPDKIIFEYLYNLPANHTFWKNHLKLTRPVFLKAAREIITALNISGTKINLADFVKDYYTNNKLRVDNEKLRKKFKEFYKDDSIQKILKSTDSKLNPWKLWIAENQEECKNFKTGFVQKIKSTLEKGFGIERTKLAFIKDS
ncbi:AAA family ATPase [Pseudomonas gingeri]|uniref:AAA family ATPase n=1 Tax=Pseudomonas gingeri TaxID=117681 RepID=UPI00159FBA9F|nr:AAA family ATPase [Pseudomonas gingeri]NWD70785.1 AAA family ATPase [Pseudomonas gingeri]